MERFQSATKRPLSSKTDHQLAFVSQPSRHGQFKLDDEPARRLTLNRPRRIREGGYFSMSDSQKPMPLLAMSTPITGPIFIQPGTALTSMT